MSLRNRACMLSLALLWQALAWLSPLGQAETTARLVNVLEHAQAVAHHHHDQLGEADEQHHEHDALHANAPHHHANEAVQSVGLVPQAGDLTAEAPRPPRVSHPSALPASVFLQGPLRPPQATLA